MDDLVKSVDSPQAAITCYQELVEARKPTGFTLKKWASNCSEVLQRIPVQDCLEANEFTLNAESSPILDLEWIIDKIVYKYVEDLAKNVRKISLNE